VVQNCLACGPASRASIDRGDVIRSIDGKKVLGDGIEAALRGNDLPGSRVQITLEKNTTVSHMVSPKISCAMFFVHVSYSDVQNLSWPCRRGKFST